MPEHANNGSLPPPPLPHRLLELRAGPEYLSSWASCMLTRYLPRGDGHPVVVIPAFMGDALSTRRLRALLRALDYETFDWRLGRNLGPVGPTERALLEHVKKIHRRRGRKPTLIGWSLGGVYARVLANTHPEHLRSVITLGSPLVHPHRSAAHALYEQASGQFEHPEHLIGIDAAPPIPVTSIYSRLDGVVNWRACLTEESDTSENIRVYGSHCGLGFQPLVHWIIADRLAQPGGAWERFSWRHLPGIRSAYSRR